MKVTWQTELPQWAILAGMFVLAAITWSWAAEQIPVRWNLAGDARPRFLFSSCLGPAGPSSPR